MSITTLLNTIAIPKKYPKPTRRSALSKYKLEYETYEQEQKIWRASTAKNKAQRTLHPTFFGRLETKMVSRLTEYRNRTIKGDSNGKE